MARFVIGVKNMRTLAWIPNTEGEGCITPGPDDCCSGSGSGSGSGCGGVCVYTCDQCPDGISDGWSFAYPGSGDVVTLCYVTTPTDGNSCKWRSPDLTWQMSYESASGAWVLENLQTGELWAVGSGSWQCTADNTFTSADGNPDITVSPITDCGAGPAIYCSSAEPSAAPYRITLAYHDCTGDFATLNGSSVDLTYDGSAYWQPAGLPAGFTTFRMSLVSPGDGGSMPTFLFEFRGAIDYDNGISPNTCSPFFMPGGGSGLSGTLGSGDLVYTITGV